MVKHIVLWKLDDDYSSSDKEEIKNEFRQKLSGLKSQIPVLLNLEVFINGELASTSNFDILLETVFNSFDDLNIYQSHPSHIRVVEYVKSLKLQRAAIDFQF
jgi:hypothetical protein